MAATFLFGFDLLTGRSKGEDLIRRDAEIKLKISRMSIFDLVYRWKYT